MKTTSTQIEVFIEIPKGDHRRRHLGYPDSSGKRSMVDLGPTSEGIPVNGGAMPIAYGFVIGTLQRGESELSPGEVPDEVDAIVYSTKEFKISEKVSATPIAIISREDGDHKIVAVDSTERSIGKWIDIPAEERELVEKYFGYKSPIKSIKGARAAWDYIEQNRVN